MTITGRALLPALLMLFELLMAVFMDKRALNNGRKSSQVRSQTGKDDSVQPRPMGANTDTTTAPTPARRYGVPIPPLGCSATIGQREARSAPAIFRRAVPVRLPRRDPHKLEPLGCNDRRRFACAPCAVWASDVMHGASVAIHHQHITVKRCLCSHGQVVQSLPRRRFLRVARRCSS